MCDGIKTEDQRYWTFSIFYTIGIVLGLFLSEFLSLSRFGYPVIPTIVWYALVPAPVILLGFPFGFLCLPFQETRKLGKAMIFSAVILGFLLFACKKIIHLTRTDRLIIPTRNSIPLIQTIIKFEQDNGSPPGKLNDLIPKYISAVPQTGFGACPEFSYTKSTSPDMCGGNPWLLSIHLPIGLCFLDSFIYAPNRNYEDFIYENKLMRIGDWGYYY